MICHKVLERDTEWFEHHPRKTRAVRDRDRVRARFDERRVDTVRFDREEQFWSRIDRMRFRGSDPFRDELPHRGRHRIAHSG